MALRGQTVLVLCSIVVLLGVQLVQGQKDSAVKSPQIHGGDWKPIVTDPKTGKNITLKMSEKVVLTKSKPKNMEPQKINLDVKSDRAGRLLIEPGNSNAFYVYLPARFLHPDTSDAHDGGSHGGGFRGGNHHHHQDTSFRRPNGHFDHGPSFGPQGPSPGPSGPSTFVPSDSGRHRPNYLPDQGSDVQPGGVRIYSGFHPVHTPPQSQNYQRPQPAYQPPPGAEPTPVSQYTSSGGPQMYIPQGEIPRPNPQSYHGPRAENGPQYSVPPQQQQQQQQQPQQYNSAPPHSSSAPQPSKFPSGGGYGVPDIDDTEDDDLPEPGYGSAPRAPSPPPTERPEPGYGNNRRRPGPDYSQPQQQQQQPPSQLPPPQQVPPQPALYVPTPPQFQSPPQIERGYGAPRRPSSYGQAPQSYQGQLAQPQSKAFDPSPRPVGIVSARPHSPSSYSQPIQRPQEPPKYSKPIPLEPPVKSGGGGGGYGRPEPYEDDDVPQRPQVRPVTVAPSPEFFPGTVSPARTPTEDEKAGVGIIEPRGLPTCAATPRPQTQSQGLRDIARELGADYVFTDFGVSEADIFSSAGNEGQFTVFLPANEARLFTNPELLASWRQNRDAFMSTLANHIVTGQITLDQLKRGGSFVTKTSQNAIINSRGHDDGVITVNGQRVIYGDIQIPNGGLLHIVGGFIHPIADEEVIPLVEKCDKYDGFDTLAAGTGFSRELAGNAGGYTLFLPSNDALSKVPKDELAVIRTNTTALIEFLRYHVAQGIHYSNDLRDGQYLTSLHRNMPLRVGVNIDGCRRRLYEVNNSPLYRADIPASNGVVHVVDWVLLPSDHKWCKDVILP
ncbi:bromodomain-containing protein 4-like [Galendromus occidentalis]|uniref:Bromodomain-containing protein 4-like n=1 Tax=Galendromus occidentalis TaxID=34638 RepID=A0AAJ7SER7_9ACAR|nr:bromodomain-containing protein 4-like [Galendromus occidentalis]